MRIALTTLVLIAGTAPALAGPWTNQSAGSGADAVHTATQLDATGAYALSFACLYGAGAYRLTLDKPRDFLAAGGSQAEVNFIPDGYLLDPTRMVAEDNAGGIVLVTGGRVDDKQFGALADALATATQAIEVRLGDTLLSFSAENVSYAIGHVSYLCLN